MLIYLPEGEYFMSKIAPKDSWIILILSLVAIEYYSTLFDSPPTKNLPPEGCNAILLNPWSGGSYFYYVSTPDIFLHFIKSSHPMLITFVCESAVVTASTSISP